MRIHYLQHVHYEGLGYIENWAVANGHSLTATKFYENPVIPHLQDFNLLIIMGGPMGVYDESKHPWLKTEKELIAASIKADKTVIGICLGAQLIAAVLGAKIKKSPHKEIGFFPIHKTEEGKECNLLSDLPNPINAFHWHGDMFEIPKNAKSFFKSVGCENQAFIYKDRVIGFQFHFETTAKSLKEMIENGRSELIMDKFVQTEKKIMSSAYKCTEANGYLKLLLARLFENVYGR